MEPESGSDDEDVILPNSPLYQYFDQPVEEDELPLPEDGETTYFGLVRDRINGAGREFAEIFVSYIDEFSNFFKSEHHRIQKRLFLNVFQFAGSKKLLIPEDVAFLQSCLTEANENEPAIRLPSSKLGFALIISFVLLLVSLCGIHMESYLTIIHCPIIRQIVRKVAVFIAAFNVSCFCYWGFLLAYHVYRCTVVFSKAKKMCISASALVDVIKKAYRIIQEFELIARGFTSATVTGIAQRLEVSTSLPINCPNRQLPELRRSLFTWANHLFMGYRYATIYLIKTSPIFTEGTSQYFATMPLKEFGDLVKYNPTSESDYQKLLKVSDNLSLSSLKAMHHLSLVQLSEFLKRFSLCFFYDSSVNEINYFDTFEKLNKYIHLLEQVTQQDVKILNLAKQTYILHRNLDIYNQQHDSIKKSPKTSPLYSYTVMARDLNIHLKAAFLKVIAIEDDLIEEDKKWKKKSKKSTTLSSSLTEKLLRAFKEIESELLTTNECISACIDAVSSKKNVKSGKSLVKESSAARTDQNVPSQSIPIIDDAEPVIEDEVLEAIAQSEPGSPDDLCMTHGEDDVIDRRITRNLMQELKKILVVKAEEHRCREERAIRARTVKNAARSDNIKGENVNADAVFDKHAKPSFDPEDSGRAEREEKADFRLDEMKKCIDVSPLDRNSPSTGNFPKGSENVLRLRFSASENKSFAESIAEMASQRQQLLNLQSDTFEIAEEEDVLSDED